MGGRTAVVTSSDPVTTSSTAPAAGGGPTIGDLLEPTGLPALLDRPVADVLADLGLVPVPTPPVGVRPEPSVPAEPAGFGDLVQPFPMLDPMALIKPITDLLGTFGTGVLGAGGPARGLDGLAGVLDAAAGALGSAATAAGDGWRGQGASAAAAKASRTAADSGALAAQGTAISADVQAAAGLVGRGLAQLQAVIVKTVGLLAAAAPTLMTPPGQLAALGIAAEGLGEALAVVASTRAQLAVPTAHVTAAGAPVPITGAPSTGLDAAGLIAQAVPLLSAGLQVAGSLLGAGATGSTTSTSGAPRTLPGAPGVGRQCCRPCDHPASVTSPNLTATEPAKRVDGAPAVPQAKPTGLPGTSAPTVASVSTPADPPAQLSDRPVTSNAPAAATAPTPQTGHVMPTGGAPAGAGVPFAPMAGLGVRPAETHDIRPSVTTIGPITTVPHDDSLSAAELNALLADAGELDVAFRPAAGDTEFVGAT